MIPHADLFLFDLKTPADTHEHCTGVPLEPILRSLHALDDAGGMIRLRCPLIPGVNMTEAHMENIASENEAPAPLAMREAEKWADRLREKTFIPVKVI